MRQPYPDSSDMPSQRFVLALCLLGLVIVTLVAVLMPSPGDPDADAHLIVEHLSSVTS